MGKRKTAGAPARSDLPDDLSNPARRALAQAGIRSLKQLSTHSVAEILALHGVGPSAIPKLRAALKAKRLTFATAKKPTK
jgi:hypothetical protein